MKNGKILLKNQTRFGRFERFPTTTQPETYVKDFISSAFTRYLGHRHSRNDTFSSNQQVPFGIMGVGPKEINARGDALIENDTTSFGDVLLCGQSDEHGRTSRVRTVSTESTRHVLSSERNNHHWKNCGSDTRKLGTRKGHRQVATLQSVYQAPTARLGVLACLTTT